MMCEICGKSMEEGFLARIEGVEMNVCSGCSRYGKIIRGVIPSKKKEGKKQSLNEHQSTSNNEEAEEIVVPEIGKILRREREKRKMEQEEFAKLIAQKGSALQKIESGDFLPSLDEAKRIGRKLRVKLTVIEEGRVFINEKGQGKELTLGDFIKVKKK